MTTPLEQYVEILSYVTVTTVVVEEPGHLGRVLDQIAPQEA